MNINLDYPQNRLAGDRLQLLATGEDFDKTTVSNLWVDPITETVMRKPNFLYGAWLSSNSGIYQKLGLSSFTVTTASAWVEVEDELIAGPWLMIKDSNFNESIKTNFSCSKNQGIYFSSNIPGMGTGQLEKLRFGFSNTADVNSNWGFILYADGLLEVYHNGSFIKSASIVSKDSEEKKSLSGRILELAIIPYRQKDILIYCYSHGGGFYVTNELIDEDETEPDIIGEVPFWVNVTNGVTKIMVAHIKYNSTGTIVSEPLSYFEPPVDDDIVEIYQNPLMGGSLPYFVYFDPSYVSNDSVTIEVLDENNNVFVPNGSRVKAKIKATLSSDNDLYTPFFYGALQSYSPRFAPTSTETLDAISRVTNLELNIGETPSDNTLEVEITDPNSLGIDDPFSIHNKSIEIIDEGIKIFEGVCSITEYLPSFVNPRTDIISFEAKDFWKILEDYRLVEPIPLDGRLLHDVIVGLVRLTGIEQSKIFVEPNDFVIPHIPGEVSGEFANFAEVGDSASEVLSKIINDYTNFSYYGFKPTISGTIFYCYSDSGLGTTPKITLYDNINDAINIGGIQPEEAYKFVYRKFTEVPLSIEANEVRVTGYDPRTQLPIQVHKADLDSIEPTTSNNLKPDNWVGYIRRFGIVDSSFNTEDLCIKVCNLLYDRLRTKRYVAEIECELLTDVNSIPLWRGDVVYLHNLDRYYRINTFNCEFVKEAHYLNHRNATYTLMRPLNNDET